MSIGGRVGQFFVFVGIIILVVFFISDHVKAPNYIYFCSGFVLLVLGVYAMWRGRNPPELSGRFGMLKKVKKKENKQERK
jgi:sugar phosphate permease